MAALKCPVHGPQKWTGEALCPACMEFLVPDVEPMTAEPPGDEEGVCAEPSCGMPLSEGRCPVHSLGAVAEPHVTRRDRDPGQPARVLFPWGPVEIDRDEVWIGRSPECGAIAAQLDRYDNVGRLHAVFLRGEDGISVRDQSSMNGTYVNERRLEPGSSRRLRHGDVVRFAADLRATVQLPGHSR
ncbi:FHA domain-containing protein [Amycolatopsis sp. DG1A-15b]|uniref:FHA domain-containing protein n=1 Tax=Amycolatopsis sp. DG1A-15b TaxID=3052846 RepID=UPI00255C19A3|nr:FHA domain-containing protein [Amycolatopsis sp. DG1A-15b]WIX92518.1 FHA domain-containing protein [Amycolatopsis sp. DG1A-15b]